MTMERKQRRELLRTLLFGGAALMASSFAKATPLNPSKQPRAIAMWDFSWLERRWPGAGYEDWDQALDELAERGYNAVRIDAYPHLVAANGSQSWLLKPQWDTEDWGAPTLVRVQVLPALYEFIAKCRDRGIKVGLSTWFRQDENNVREGVHSPEKLADIWRITLAGIQRAGLLDNILYVDLSNEWPGHVWSPIKLTPEAQSWADPRSMPWMRTAIAGVRREFPDLPLLFSTDNDTVEEFAEYDVSFMDAIEHHLWMVGENDDEFYKLVGYKFQRFSQAGYHNVQLKAAPLYAARPAYWNKLLTDKIARLAKSAHRAKQPLMTTECWAIIDYKDWPLLPWDWVKDVCDLGTSTASATGQWAALATSNFCGPQFRGMWRDVEWHRRLTSTIKAGSLDSTLRTGRLWNRL
jgi:hypothetical protein